MLVQRKWSDISPSVWWHVCSQECGRIFQCLNQCLICLGIKPPPYPAQRTFNVRSNSKFCFKEPFIHAALSRTSSDGFCYPDNTIRSARYRFWNFVPLNLLEQLQRIANFYFFTGVIFTFFVVEVMHPATAIVPFLFVIGVTMVKQGYEDVRRARSDTFENSKPVTVLYDKKAIRKSSSDVKVGDILMCTDEDFLPCDMILLSCDNPAGTCYATTSNIDGESNLKTFTAVYPTKEWNTVESICTNLNGQVICEQPTVNLYRFLGTMILHLHEQITVPLGPDNLLLRGMRLKGTAFMIGVAVYTGCDTKIVLNSKVRRSRRSSVERRLNYFLIVMLVVKFLLVLICTAMSVVYYKARWYEVAIENTSMEVVKSCTGFYLLLSFLVPISLYVTIEFQRFVGSYFFKWDSEMRFEEENGTVRNAQMKCTDMSDELGQIRCLFSDKTGTLTENDMRFRACSTLTGTFEELIPGHLYQLKTIQKGEEDRRISSALVLNSEILQKNPAPRNLELMRLVKAMVLCHTVYVHQDAPAAGKTKQAQFKDEEIPQTIELQEEFDLASESTPDEGIEDEDKDISFLYEYQAASPDERAAVEACGRFGVIFHGKIDECYSVSIGGVYYRYKVMLVFPFDSNRRCMSIVVQDEGGEFFLYTKGADSSIIPKLSPNMPKKQVAFLTENVKIYAENGLRTLVYAFKPITKEKLSQLMSKMARAQSSLEDREELLDAVYRNEECNLVLLGCIAVEDRLQDGVIQTLRCLQEARIQVFVLTGDKEETALNICLACGHITHNMTRFRVTQVATRSECEHLLDYLLHYTHLKEKVSNRSQQYNYLGPHKLSSHDSRSSKEISGKESDPQRESNYGVSETTPTRSVIFRPSFTPSGEFTKRNACTPYAVTVDGPSLTIILESMELRRNFLMLCLRSCAVLCCRMAPLQKAEVIRLIKSQYSYLTPMEISANLARNYLLSSKRSHQQANRVYGPPTTAAIGDGANDVSMLSEADVSFGLFGKEGPQAARAADFAFSKFKYLRPALFVHGHYYYSRLTNTILYFFYKNIVFILTQVIFMVSNRFSALSVYTQLTLIGYNVLITCLPIFAYALTEQPFSREKLLRRPSLYYTKLAHNAMFTWGKFSQWVILACWHSTAIYGGALLLFWGDTSLTKSGQTSGFELFSTFITACVILLVNAKLIIETKYLNIFLLGAIFVTLIGNGALFLLFSEVDFGNPEITLPEYGRLTNLMRIPVLWLFIALVVCVALVPDLVLIALHNTLELAAKSPTHSSSQIKMSRSAQVHLKNIHLRSMDTNEVGIEAAPVLRPC